MDGPMPRFRYTNVAAAAVDFTVDRVCDPWTLSYPGIGGLEFSAGRVPAGYEVRRDSVLTLPVRFSGAFFTAVRLMVEHGQRGTEIEVFPDGVNSHVAYLTEPRMDGGLDFDRDRYAGDWVLRMEFLAKLDASTWETMEYYG